MILAIETSQFSYSVALGNNDGPIAFVEKKDGMAVAHLSQMISEVLERQSLKANQITAIAVSEGPGSFSSLRTGFAFAKGMCLCLDKPLILVPSLQALAAAQSASRSYIYYISSIFARQGEIYAAVYNEALEMLEEPRVVFLDSGQLEEWAQKYAGAALLKDAGWELPISTRLHEVLNICPSRFSAGSIIKLGHALNREGKWANLDTAVPFYLKDPNITTPKVKIHNSLNY